MNPFSCIALLLCAISLPISLDATSVQRNLGDFLNRDTLIVGNYPEQVTHAGTVFRKPLKNSPLRVLYYYFNPTQTRLAVNLVVHNQGSQDAEIELLEGYGGPTSSGLSAGHRSSISFLSKLNKEKWTKISIPKGTTHQITYHEIKPNMTTSGIVRIGRLQGENVEVELQIVEEPFAQFTRLVPKSPFRTPFRYAETSVSVVKKTVLFSPEHLIKEIQIGGPPYIKDKNHDILVKGNYGVVYEIHLELVNNTDSYEKVDLFFSRIRTKQHCFFNHRY